VSVHIPHPVNTWIQAATQDSLSVSTPAESIETAYDSIWAGQVPTAALDPLESVMLAEDKLYVVLAVVLIIWFGILVVLFRTDRRIARLERTLAEKTTRDDQTSAEEK
jgi:hypothetical protein